MNATTHKAENDSQGCSVVPTPHNSKLEDEDEDYEKIKVNHETEEERSDDHQPKDAMDVHAHAIVRRTWLTPWETA